MFLYHLYLKVNVNAQDVLVVLVTVFSRLPRESLISGSSRSVSVVCEVLVWSTLPDILVVFCLSGVIFTVLHLVRSLLFSIV